MSSTPPAAASPCNDICRIDPCSGLCVGCQRTLDEIARWAAMPEAHKRAMLDALPARRVALRSAQVPEARP